MNEEQRNGAKPVTASVEPDAPEQFPETGEDIDLLTTLREGSREDAPADLTLGGYMREHDRPSAFEGADGQPYTVDVDVAATASDEPDRSYAAFFVFIRWAGTGAGILDHVESDDIAFGGTEEEARDAALSLTLYEVRAELDAAIGRRDRELGY